MPAACCRIATIDGVVEYDVDATRNYTAPLTGNVVEMTLDATRLHRTLDGRTAVLLARRPVPDRAQRHAPDSRRPTARRRRRADGNRLRPDRPPARSLYRPAGRVPRGRGIQVPGMVPRHTIHGTRTRRRRRPSLVRHHHPFEDGNGRIGRSRTWRWPGRKIAPSVSMHVRADPRGAQRLCTASLTDNFRKMAWISRLAGLGLEWKERVHREALHSAAIFKGQLLGACHPIG